MHLSKIYRKVLLYTAGNARNTYHLLEKRSQGFPREKMMTSDYVFLSAFNLLQLINSKYYVLEIRKLFVSFSTAFILGFRLLSYKKQCLFKYQNKNQGARIEQQIIGNIIKTIISVKGISYETLTLQSFQELKWAICWTQFHLWQSSGI